MIQITAQMRVLVAIEPVDGRKGIDSLVRLCQDKLAEDPFSGCVFVFRSQRTIRMVAGSGSAWPRGQAIGSLRSAVAVSRGRRVASESGADVAARARAEVKNTAEPLTFQKMAMHTILAMLETAATTATAELKYRGQVIDSSDILYIREFIAANSGVSRRKLSEKLCE